MAIITAFPDRDGMSCTLLVTRSVSLKCVNYRYGSCTLELIKAARSGGRVHDESVGVASCKLKPGWKTLTSTAPGW